MAPLASFRWGFLKRGGLPRTKPLKYTLQALFLFNGEPIIHQPGCLEVTHYGQVFMLRRAIEEPKAHATALMPDISEDANRKGIINTTQRKVLLQQVALSLA